MYKKEPQPRNGKPLTYSKVMSAQFTCEESVWKEAGELFPRKRAKFIGQFLQEIIRAKKSGKKFCYIMMEFKDVKS